MHGAGIVAWNEWCMQRPHTCFSGEATIVQRAWRFVVVVGTLACVLGSGCSQDEDPKVPAEEIRFPAAWAGVWRVNFPYQDCQTDSLLGIDVTVDSICTGETLEEFLGIPEDQVDVDCVGTITDAEFSAHCSGRTEQLGVVLTITADFTATRADSVFNGGGMAVFRYEYGNSTDSDCYDVSFDAKLLAPVAPDCAASSATVMVKPLARALSQRPSFRN